MEVIHRRALIGLAVILCSLTALLVLRDAVQPGFCPRYPLLGVPACRVVLVYFAVMLAAAILPWTPLARAAFFAAASLAFLSSLWFSAIEMTTPGHQCPQLFGVPLPLCFTVAPMMAAMAFIALRGTEG